jgi:putative ABC transport system substrate-binding protein
LIVAAWAWIVDSTHALTDRNRFIAATSTIPIVFLNGGGDPLATGLVASFHRPGGNVTGVNFLANDLLTKQLSLMREPVPKARVFAVLLNPHSNVVDSIVTDLQAALRFP